MNRTQLDECFRVAGRTTWYLDPAEIQRDLDRFLAYYYHLQRRHPGYRLAGRTPAQALQEALGLDALPPLVPVEGEEVTDTGCRVEPQREQSVVALLVCGHFVKYFVKAATRTRTVSRLTSQERGRGVRASERRFHDRGRMRSLSAVDYYALHRHLATDWQLTPRGKHEHKHHLSRWHLS
jgi:hypothetical protein